jgi:CysZ protein
VLIKYSVTPMVINLIIYGSIFFVGFSRLLKLIDIITGGGTENISFWMQLLHVFLIIISFIIIIFICYLLFIIFGGLVTAPFNEELSQRVEEIVTGTKAGKLGFWVDALISIKGETQKIIFYLSVLCVLFLIALIPVAGNIISIVLGVIFSFYYNALDFLDYPMTRKLATFRTKIKVTSSGKMLTYGFGCISFIMMFLPVINVFMKPILVVAGTSLYYEKYYRLQLSEKQ